MSTEPKKIYLAGPMTGLPEYNYPEFESTTATLRKHGWDVVSPVEIARDMGYSRDLINSDHAVFFNLMRAEKEALMDCDAIMLLEGWERSKGTRAELQLALSYNMEVICIERYYGNIFAYSTQKEV